MAKKKEEVIVVSPADVIAKLFPNMIVNEEGAKAYDDEMNAKYKASAEEELRKRGIPEAYLNKTWADFVCNTEEKRSLLGKLQKYAEQCKRGESLSLIFNGEYGTGKTLLSCILCKELNGYFTRASGLLNELNAGKSFSAKESVNDIICRYGRYKFLVIDELGRGARNQLDGDLLFQILNERIENGKPTIVCSNLSMTDINEYLGGAFKDRAYNWRVVPFTWESFRKNPVEL